jgi:hypothetical protein
MDLQEVSLSELERIEGGGEQYDKCQRECRAEPKNDKDTCDRQCRPLTWISHRSNKQDCSSGGK